LLCRYCGHENDDDNFYCVYCGKNVANKNHNADETSRLNSEHPEAHTGKNKSHPVGKTRRAAVLLVLTIILAVACIVLVYGWVSSSDMIRSYETENERLQEFADAVAPDGLYVNVQSVYNSLEDGKKLSEDLVASEIKYLSMEYQIYTPTFIFNFWGKELEVRIINNGKLVEGKGSSPTYSFTKKIDTGIGNAGWGSKTGGTYQPGYCTIQFVYQNRVVGEKTVTIR
jgi:hypothetical protein